MPPISDPAPHRPSSGPADAVLPSPAVAAATPTSTAPKRTPTAINTSTRVRIAGERRQPPRPGLPSPDGRRPREAGSAANAVVATRRTAPETARAMPVELMAPRASTSGGPRIQVSSAAVASRV